LTKNRLTFSIIPKFERRKRMKRKNFWGAIRTYIASLLVVTLVITYVPFEEFTHVFAETNASHDSTKDQKGTSKSKGRKEITSLRTATSKTYLNEDGTYTAEISQTPIHYKDKQNKWVDIDNNLVSNSKEDVYQNKANSFQTKFAKQEKQGSPVMQVADDDHTAAMELEPLDQNGQEPANVKGEVKDNSIEYPNVFSNVNLKYTVGSDRVKEDIVYKEKPKDGFPSQFTYKLNIKGLYVKEVGGILYLYDTKTDKPIYYFSTPIMYDSYKPKGFKAINESESIPEEAISYDVKLTYETKGNNLYLHVIPNKKWLEDPNRIYPITIDPTIVKIQSNSYVEDTNLRSGFPTQTGGNDLELGAGFAAGSNNVIRSLLKFDLSSIPGGTTILSSSVNLWLSSASSDTPINISLYKVTKDWIENQASWNYAKTSPSTAWTNKGGDFQSTRLATLSDVTEPVDLSFNMKWDIPTSVITDWKNNPSTNYGFLIKSDSEGTNTYKKFFSSENTIDEKYHPLLVVTYKTNARLGLEDYWPYDSHPLVGGESYTNLTTGNNVIQFTDFSLPGRGGFGLDFTRTYNSKSVENSAFGYGWTFTGNEALYIDSSTNSLIYEDEDGTDHNFTYDSTNKVYRSDPGTYLTITSTSKFENNHYVYYYEMQDKYGNKTVFKVGNLDYETNTRVAFIQYKEDRHGNRINYEYDDNNRLIKITSDLGNGLTKSISFSYNSDGKITEATYEGSDFKYYYDTSGHLQFVDQLKNDGTYTRTTFEYKNGYISAVIDPNGRRTDYTYNNEILTKVQEPDEINGVIDPADRPGTTYNIDIAAKKAIVTDPKGNDTTYYTDSNYVVTEKDDPEGNITKYHYDSNYNPTIITEISGDNSKQTTNTYDSNGNLLSSIDPEGNEEDYTYTTFSNVKTYKDSLKNTTTYEYNDKGDLQSVQSPSGDVTSYAYDSNGDLQSITYPNGKVENHSIDYNSSTKTVTTISPSGATSTVITDYKGNVLEKIDGNGNHTKYGYDSKGELTTVTDAKNHITSYGYDNAGNLQSVRNANNAISTFSYDGNNQLITKTDPLENVHRFTYDDNGNKTDVYTPNQNHVTYKYDGIDRITDVSVDGKSYFEYTYDDENNTTQINKENTPFQTIHYLDNELIDYIKDRNNMLTYSYSGNQYVNGLHYTVGSDSRNISFTPNSNEQTTQVSKDGQNVASFTYTKNGDLQKTQYSNNAYIDMQYDIDGRISSVKNYLNSTTSLEDTYTYDKNNNITQITTNRGVIKYEYDELNQLIKEIQEDGTVITYTYDNAGNLTSKSQTKGSTTTTTNYVYDSANKLTDVNGVKYTYDKNGNLLSDGNKTYTYNALNQLIEVKDKDGKVIAQYEYDDEGKRIRSVTSKGTINYFYDGDQVLYETDQNNKLIAEYTYNDAGQPVSMDKDGKRYYYHYNAHGDVIALTDESGNIVAQYHYDAWGNIISQEGPMASENPYRYAGYRYDEETNMYYLLARYYNPSIQRFISVDPQSGKLDNPITQNQYVYANNNPIMFVDPDGNFSRQHVIYALKYAIKYWLANYIGWDNAGWIFASVWSFISKGREAYKISHSNSLRQAAELLSRSSRTILKQARAVAIKAALKAGWKAGFPFSAISDGYLLVRGFYKGWRKYKD
jgi:RHS repeat-associated protein